MNEKEFNEIFIDYMMEIDSCTRSTGEMLDWSERDMNELSHLIWITVQPALAKILKYEKQ